MVVAAVPFFIIVWNKYINKKTHNFPHSCREPYHDGLKMLWIIINTACSFWKGPNSHKGAFTPTRSGSARGCIFRAGRVFTLVRVRAQFYFTGAPFRGTGSLIYKYRPISAPYSCGSRRRIAPWAISAGARRGPAAEAERARGGVNSTTQFLQTDPLRNPRAGSARAPRAFSALV